MNALKEKKMVFRNKKRKRGVECRLFTNLVVEIKTSFISRSYGLRIPNDLRRFIRLPDKTDEPTRATATFISEGLARKEKLANIAVELFLREDAYTNRNNEKKIIQSVYLKPLKKNYLARILVIN